MTLEVSETPAEFKRMIDVEEEREKRIVDFVNKRQMAALAIIASYSPRRISPTRRAFAEVGVSEEFGIESALSAFPSECKSVMLLVNSMGGAVASSYMVAKAIRDRFDDVQVYVPHWALSGGTLISLTGNKIFMGTMSKLSPINVQTEYQGTVVSLNALLRAKAKLDAYFMTVSEDDAPYPMRVMVEKLDPIIMEDWTGEQVAMQEYAEEILSKCKCRNGKNIANRLVNEFIAHSYVLNYERAKKLKLNVHPSSEDPEGWEVMRFWLAKYITRATEKHFIRYAYPASLVKKQKKSTSASDAV